MGEYVDSSVIVEEDGEEKEGVEDLIWIDFNFRLGVLGFWGIEELIWS